MKWHLKRRNLTLRVKGPFCFSIVNCINTFGYTRTSTFCAWKSKKTWMNNSVVLRLQMEKTTVDDPSTVDPFVLVKAAIPLCNSRTGNKSVLVPKNLMTTQVTCTLPDKNNTFLSNLFLFKIVCPLQFFYILTTCWSA